MKTYCEDAIKYLGQVNGKEWGELYVNLRMDFHRKHGNKLITSTWHGLDFFHNLLFILNGGDINSMDEPKGEYRNNFIKLTQIGLTNIKTVVI